MSEQNLSTPLPRKVRGGEFWEKGLVLQTTLSEEHRIEWPEVLFLYLGKIEVKAPPRPGKPSGPRINLVRTAAALAAGPIGTGVYDLAAAKRKQPEIQSRAESFYLFDVYVSGSTSPFRFDSVGTSFKKFLKEEAGYSSDLNFINFAKKIYPLAGKARESGVVLLVEKGKGAVQVFPSRDEFAWKSFQEFRRISA